MINKSNNNKRMRGRPRTMDKSKINTTNNTNIIDNIMDKEEKFDYNNPIIEVNEQENVIIGKDLKASDSTFVYDKYMEKIELPDGFLEPEKRKTIIENLESEGAIVKQLKDNVAVVTRRWEYGYLTELQRNRTPGGLEDWDIVTTNDLEKDGIKTAAMRFRNMGKPADNKVWRGDSFLCRKPVKVVVEKREQRKRKEKDDRMEVMERLEKSGLRDVLGSRDFIKFQNLANKNPSVILNKLERFGR